MTCWPTRIVSESPVRATRMALVTRSSCRSETSAPALAERMVARTTSPPIPSTVISSMPLTTWAAVMTLPSLETRTPEPVSLKRVTPGADVPPLAPHDDDGGADSGEEVVQARALGLGRRAEGRQGGYPDHHREDLLHEVEADPPRSPPEPERVGCVDRVLHRGYEGMVAKNPESPYVAGRTLKWLKVKVPKYREEERGVLQALTPHTAIAISHQIGREL